MATGTLAASPANPRTEARTGTKSMERVKIEEAGLGFEVNEFNWDLSNKFLALLVRKAKQRTDWSAVMLEELTDKEFEQNTKVVEEKLAYWGSHLGIDKPVGAVVGGTGPLREGFDITGEQAQQAVQILKACGRLVQCGRGRGKCLVVMTTKPVPRTILGAPAAPRPVAKPVKAAKRPARGKQTTAQARVREAAASTNGAHPSDRVMESLRRMIELANDLVEHYPLERQELETQLAAARAEADPGRLSQLIADKAGLERRLAELEAVLAQREHTIKSLEVELAEKQLTSWS